MIEATERQIEKAIFDWLKYHKDVGDYAFKIANEAGSRSTHEMKSLVDRGLKPGFPDIGILIPNDNIGYHGLFLELKTKKGRLSNVQKIWLKRLEDKKYMARAVYGLDEAIEIISLYAEI